MFKNLSIAGSNSMLDSDILRKPESLKEIPSFARESSRIM